MERAKPGGPQGGRGRPMKRGKKFPDVDWEYWAFLEEKHGVKHPGMIFKPPIEPPEPEEIPDHWLKVESLDEMELRLFRQQRKKYFLFKNEMARELLADQPHSENWKARYYKVEEKEGEEGKEPEKKEEKKVEEVAPVEPGQEGVVLGSDEDEYSSYSTAIEENYFDNSGWESDEDSSAEEVLEPHVVPYTYLHHELDPDELNEVSQELIDAHYIRNDPEALAKLTPEEREHHDEVLKTSLDRANYYHFQTRRAERIQQNLPFFSRENLPGVIIDPVTDDYAWQPTKRELIEEDFDFHEIRQVVKDNTFWDYNEIDFDIADLESIPEEEMGDTLNPLKKYTNARGHLVISEKELDEEIERQQKYSGYPPYDPNKTYEFTEEQLAELWQMENMDYDKFPQDIDPDLFDAVFHDKHREEELAVQAIQDKKKEGRKRLDRAKPLHPDVLKAKEEAGDDVEKFVQALERLEAEGKIVIPSKTIEVNPDDDLTTLQRYRVEQEREFFHMNPQMDFLKLETEDLFDDPKNPDLSETLDMNIETDRRLSQLIEHVKGRVNMPEDLAQSIYITLLGRRQEEAIDEVIHGVLDANEAIKMWFQPDQITPVTEVHLQFLQDVMALQNKKTSSSSNRKMDGEVTSSKKKAQKVTRRR